MKTTCHHYHGVCDHHVCPKAAAEKAASAGTKTLVEILAEVDAKKAQGPWVPASGGTETPFKTRSGKTLLYCWQPSTGNHAYLDVGTDLFLTNEEAAAVLA